MDKIVFICICMLFVCQSINAAYEQQWRVAKAKYGLSFKDAKAERTAFNTYARNMEMIEQKNAFGNLGYELGENQLTHLTEQEIQEQLLIEPGLLANHLSQQAIQSEVAAELQGIEVGAATTTKTSTKASTTTTSRTTTTTSTPIPDSIDYSYTFNPAKNQGSCGSCYTFSSIAVMESQYYLKYNAKISLSEQQLVDCTFNNVSGNFGCNGGWSDKCLRYANATGIVKTSDYAYLAKLTTCSTATITAATNKVFVTQTGTVTPVRDELALKKFVALNGPVSVYVQAVGDFFSYKSGVMNNTKCVASDGYINHAITLVGYGTENGKDYWLIRNSWGTTWGINGYAKMIRNSNNNCRIASFPYFAKVK